MTTLEAAAAFCVSNEFAARLIKTIAEKKKNETINMEAKNERLLMVKAALVSHTQISPLSRSLSVSLSQLSRAMRLRRYKVGLRFRLIQCAQCTWHMKSRN